MTKVWKQYLEKTSPAKTKPEVSQLLGSHLAAMTRPNRIVGDIRSRVEEKLRMNRILGLELKRNDGSSRLSMNNKNFYQHLK